jgi:predicted nucleic acid-binding protein
VAGSAQYTAVLDANVLYPALLRNVLLSLADADLYSAKWSVHIRDEWTRSLLRNKPGMEAQISAAARAMEEAIPDCLVSGYEHLIEGLQLPDPEDRHVLAAAIAGHADAIVTWNEKDFPREILDPFGIEIQTPDEFVLNQLMLEKVTALAALKRMRERLARPQYDAQALVALMEKRGLAQTAAHLLDVVALI